MTTLIGRTWLQVTHISSLKLRLSYQVNVFTKWLWLNKWGTALAGHCVYFDARSWQGMHRQTGFKIRKMSQRRLWLHWKGVNVLFSFKINYYLLPERVAKLQYFDIPAMSDCWKIFIKLLFINSTCYCIISYYIYHILFIVL